jgi:hypothetical protein
VRSPSGIFVCQEAKKAFDRRQSAVPSGDLNLAGSLSIIEEFDDPLLSQVRSVEFGYLSLEQLRDEAKKQTPAVAVGNDRVVRYVALVCKPMSEIRLQKLMEEDRISSC